MIRAELPMQTDKVQRFYHPELDGLRFIAFLLVFIHNAPYIATNEIWKTIRERSWIGVDLFFCLSGFLITRLLVIEHQKNGGISIQNFYIRRALRIWPLYFLITVVAAVYTIANRGFQLEIAQRIFGLVTFTDNFFASIFNFTIVAFSLHLWTISYEQQFYIVIPHIIKKLLNLSYKTKIFIYVFAFLAGNLVRCIFIYLELPSFSIYVLPFTHFEALLGGIIMGMESRKPHQGYRHHILLLLGFFSLIFTFVLPSKDITGWHLMLTYPLTGIGITFMLYILINSRNNLQSSLLGNKYIVYLGKISYGLYVYHIVSMYLATYILIFLQSGLLDNEFPPQNLFALAFIITISISIFSYRIIEMPFLKFKNRFTTIYSRSV